MNSTGYHSSQSRTHPATPGASYAASPYNQSLGSEDGPEESSLPASITNYPIHDGRRYHSFREGSYLFPNDEAENERLDLQHKMLMLAHGGRIFFAPLRNPRRILDVGTGTGIWAVEMANYFPNAEIIGNDLSPIQPNVVPPNVEFEIDDISAEDWAYDECFDYIHSRCMLGSLPKFKNLISNSFKYLNPNGYLECQDWLLDLCCDDDSLTNALDYPFRDWVDYAHQASQYYVDPPRPLRMAHRIEGWMRETGFVDIQVRVDKVPMNDWPEDPHMKTLGWWNKENWLDGLGGFTYGFFGSRGLGWTNPEIEVFLVGVRRSIQDRNVRAYQNFYCVTGKKPGPYEGDQEEESGEEDEEDDDEEEAEEE